MEVKPFTIFRTLLLFSFILVFLCHAGFAGVKNTKHDLSVNSTGATLKATTETQICIFCHTPHNADPAYPLWGHEVTSAEYTHYTSTSLVSYASEADAPPIDGISRLCLSCHDGTIALGAVIGRTDQIGTTGATATRSIGGTIPKGATIPIGGTIPTNLRYMPSTANGYLGTNLSGGHPISIIYDQSLVSKRANLDPNLMQLNPVPLNDRDVKLYPTQGGYGVQCSSCHDPHGGKGSSTAPPFWQKTNYEDVCLVCHNTYRQEWTRIVTY